MRKLLNYIVVNKENIDLAIKIQNIIFPDEDGKKDLLDSIGKHSYKELVWWIMYYENEPTGIVGLYSFNKYPDDAFMGWYGILPNVRGKGYGEESFDFFEEYARKHGYKNIRLYTDDVINFEATKLYYKKGMISEEYRNPKDIIFSKGKIVIFSKSLTDNLVKKWNSKYIGISE